MRGMAGKFARWERRSRRLPALLRFPLPLMHDLLKEIKRGIYLVNADMSSDFALRSTQSWGLMLGIENGVITHRIQKAFCEFRTTDLWKSMNGIGDADTIVTENRVTWKGWPSNAFDSTVSAPAGRFASVDLVHFAR
jgi:predicted Zn-dependent protease